MGLGKTLQALMAVAMCHYQPQNVGEFFARETLRGGSLRVAILRCLVSGVGSLYCTVKPVDHGRCVSL